MFERYVCNNKWPLLVSVSRPISLLLAIYLDLIIKIHFFLIYRYEIVPDDFERVDHNTDVEKRLVYDRLISGEN